MKSLGSLYGFSQESVTIVFLFYVVKVLVMSYASIRSYVNFS